MEISAKDTVILVTRSGMGDSDQVLQHNLIVNIFPCLMKTTFCHL